jgi:hypothetical protein
MFYPGHFGKFLDVIKRKVTSEIPDDSFFNDICADVPQTWWTMYRD